MTYQVLARKWRPQDFAALIGQEPIVTALTNALGEGRIAQAYLFSGIRGVGKTTAARLLAKALNCEEGPTATPCNRCTACREITAGANLDVIEVDAATYSKVEQVRELTESLRYGPARDRYKVVVLDEIHRLSRQAFDALLKIVEEPPPHLVFVFATTEAEAVPATVLSRCQEFHFRRVAADTVAGHLASIAEAEGIAASETALRLIARAGEGSVRDAVALLDQLATFGGGTIDDEDAARLLGGLDVALLRELLRAVLAGEAAEVSRLAARLEDEGWDPRQAHSHFLAYCRDALHLAMAGGDDGVRRVDLPQEDVAALAGIAGEAGYENLLRLLQLLLAGEQMVRRSDNGYLAVEIAWLRAAELPKLVRIEEILGGGAAAGGGTGSGGRGAGARGAAVAAERTARAGRPAAAAGGEERRDVETPAPVARAAASGPKEPSEAATAVAEAHPAAASAPDERREVETPAAATRAAVSSPGAPEPAPPGSAPQPSPAAEPASPSRPAQSPAEPGPSNGRGRVTVRPAAEPAGTIEAFLAEIRREKQPLAAHLDAADLEIEGDRLVIRHEPDDDWLRTRLTSASNRKLIDRAVAAAWGEGIRWETREGERRAASGEGAEEGAAADPEVAGHPTVQTVLQLFGGQIETVEDRPEETER